MVSSYFCLFFMNLSGVFVVAKFITGLSLGLCTVIANVSILEILPIRLHRIGFALFQCNVIFAFLINLISIPFLKLVGMSDGSFFEG